MEKHLKNPKSLTTMLFGNKNNKKFSSKQEQPSKDRKMYLIRR